jgi:hypothetical protein
MTWELRPELRPLELGEALSASVPPGLPNYTGIVFVVALSMHFGISSKHAALERKGLAERQA